MLIVVLLEAQWRGEERKSIYPLKIDGQDELNPTDEPNPAPNESLGQGKARPGFFTRARWFGARFVPPGMSHGMSKCLNGPLI